MGKELLSLNVIKHANAAVKTCIKAGSAAVVWGVFLAMGREQFDLL